MRALAPRAPRAPRAPGSGPASGLDPVAGTRRLAVSLIDRSTFHTATGEFGFALDDFRHALGCPGDADQHLLGVVSGAARDEPAAGEFHRGAVGMGLAHGEGGRSFIENGETGRAQQGGDFTLGHLTWAQVVFFDAAQFG